MRAKIYIDISDCSSKELSPHSTSEPRSDNYLFGKSLHLGADEHQLHQNRIGRAELGGMTTAGFDIADESAGGYIMSVFPDRMRCSGGHRFTIYLFNTS